MKFNTCIPAEALRLYVKQFAIHETDGERVYKVLPDTGLVMGFQYKGVLSYLDGENEVTLSNSGVTGLRDTYRMFKNVPGTGTVLVYFKDAGAAAFFKQPLHGLFRESVSLDNFMLRSGLLILEEQLCEAPTDREKIGIVEQFLLARMEVTAPDKLVLAALSLIYKSAGNIRIGELAKQLHTSESPLEKKFRAAVGASPKKFASIVRVKNAMQLYNPSTSLTALGYEAGFYDQAHFIKEFKTFTGDTPEHYFTQNP